MLEKETQKWSEGERELLQHEKFIAEVMKLRHSPGKESLPKPRWQIFLESAGGTALVTAIIGGIFGSYISSAIQLRDKEKELARVSYKERIVKQQETVEQAYELIGSFLSASNDLIALTKPTFDIRRYSGEEREKVRRQRDTIRLEYNKLLTRWQNKRLSVGLLMGYYYKGNSGVTNSWQNLQVSISGYGECAERWYSSQVSPSESEIAGACKIQKDTVRENLGKLTISLSMAQNYP